MPRPTITLSNDTPTRAHIEQLLAEDALLVFDACDLEGADLSRLNPQDCLLISGEFSRGIDLSCSNITSL